MAVLLGGLFAGLASGDAVYTYTGGDFDSFIGNAGVTTADHVSFSLEVTTEFATNTTYSNCCTGIFNQPSVVPFVPESWSISDGGVLSQSLINNEFDFITDGNGNIEFWNIEARGTQAPFSVSTQWGAGCNCDNVTIDDFNSAAASTGTWATTQTSATPEPGTLSLLAIGVAALVSASGRVHARPSSF